MSVNNVDRARQLVRTAPLIMKMYAKHMKVCAIMPQPARPRRALAGHVLNCRALPSTALFNYLLRYERDFQDGHVEIAYKRLF